jgi:undecaprenyl-diphosphatase
MADNELHSVSEPAQVGGTGGPPTADPVRHNGRLTSGRSGTGGSAVAGAPRLRWGIVGAAAALALLTIPLDRWVIAGLTAEAVRPGLEQAIGLLKGLAPAGVILAILSVFPNRRRLYVGFLVPLLGHLPILHLLKWLIGRARPLAEQGPFHFEPLSAAKYADAFPSGHTAGATVFALLLAMYFPRLRWVFYIWLVLMGLERVVLRMHYLSDVIAGYALGAAVVYGCVRLLGVTFYERDAGVQKVSSVSSHPQEAKSA